MELIGLDKKVVEVDGIKFTIRPQLYSDLTYAVGRVFALELEKMARANALAIFPLMRRIVAWEGVTIQGKPAACTMENIELLFGQNPNYVNLILEELGKDGSDAKEVKNLEASPSGSESGTSGPNSSKPATPAGN